MPPLPPTKDVIDALQLSVFPAAAGAALVTCLLLTLGRRVLSAVSLAAFAFGHVVPRFAFNKVLWESIGRGSAALASAAGVVFGFGWANYAFNLKKWKETGLVVWENTSRIFPWTVEPDSRDAWHWLPRAALILIVVGLVSRWIGSIAARYLPERRWWGANLLVWAPRIAVLVAVSGWLVSVRAATESPWLRPVLPVVMLLIWITLDGLAQARAGGEIAAYLGVVFYAGGTVLLYAHTGRFMEAAVILGSAMFGIAVATNVAKADVSGAIPAAVVFLPGLLLTTRPSLAENNVPAASFWLIALAPLVLAPFLLPALVRRESWWTQCLRTILILTPVVVAVILAAQHEKLVFEEDW